MVFVTWETAVTESHRPSKPPHMSPPSHDTVNTVTELIKQASVMGKSQAHSDGCLVSPESGLCLEIQLLSLTTNPGHCFH